MEGCVLSASCSHGLAGWCKGSGFVFFRKAVDYAPGDDRVLLILPLSRRCPLRQEMGLEELEYSDLAIRLQPGGGGGPAGGRRGGSGGRGAEPSPVSAGGGVFGEAGQASEAGGSG